MLALTGDIYLGDRPDRLVGSGLDVLRESDLVVCNLECVVASADAPKRADKSAILTTNEQTVRAFLDVVEAPVLFTLGNNHVHDLGESGISSTLECLQDLGCTTGGVGLPDEVARPCLLEHDGRTVALLPVSTDEPEVMSKVALEDFRGVLDLNAPRVVEVIREWKGRADYVVVLPHWGREHLDYPAVQLRRRAYALIDAGADLVVGHHPHLVQGKEEYRGRWIYYSLGNFFFPNFCTKEGIVRKWRGASNRSVALRVRFGPEGIEIEEMGFSFDPDTFRVERSTAALEELRRKSTALDVERLSHKRYFSVWERNYLRVIGRQRATWRRLREAFFPQHQVHGVAGYFLRRVGGRIGKALHGRR